MNNKIASIPFLTLIFILFPMLTIDETGSMGMLVWGGLLFFSLLLSAKEVHKGRSWPVFAILTWFFGVFSTVISPYGELGHDVIKYLAFVLLLITLSNHKYDEKDFRVAFIFYTIVSVVLAILIILSFIYGYPHVESIYEGSIRYSIGITGIYKNPNYIGAFINLCIFICTYLLFFVKCKPLHRIFLLLIIVIMLVAIFLTGTRAAILTIGVALVLFFIYNYRVQKNILYKIVPLVILLSLILKYASDIIGVVETFGSARGGFSEDIRMDSWAYAFKKFEDSFLFGHGINSWNSFKTDSYLPGLHNIFLEFLLNQGVIGLVFLLLTMFIGWGKVKREDRFFVAVFCFVNIFPLLFQNGLIDVTFWRVILINRIVIDFSSYSGNGVIALLDLKSK